ncbi:mechanosensitive ion channel family protein [Ulvibacterium marinum]|uniref:Mechanosensitive ion channel family protein n=1 Tax=Ulvibacterium marinum TaxID=2419782 RepID=A0A3B0C1Q9_9FLAO|nr:mechanosensitive ion channel family protein [Ulvibacterium marinum]RKN78801.1 mechanosensitive ion channel family protein [Ulvibacterium marinum]
MKTEIQTSFTDIYDKLIGWAISVIHNLPNLLVAIIVMVIAYYLAKVVNKWAVRLASRSIPQKAITNLIGRAAAIVVVLVGLFLALGALDLSKALNTLLAGAGISGLVIGLALQGTLSNMLSGIQLSFRKKIQIGHWIETTGYEGEVVDINLNSLVLQPMDNTRVIIPNKTIIENPLKNYSLTSNFKIEINCGVGYGSDLDKVEQLVKDTIKNLNQVDKNTDVEFYYRNFGDSAIDFSCRYWVNARDVRNRLEAKSIGIKAIKAAFNANDINIPFPIRTLQFDNELEFKNKEIGEVSQN